MLILLIYIYQFLSILSIFIDQTLSNYKKFTTLFSDVFERKKLVISDQIVLPIVLITYKSGYLFKQPLRKARNF